MPEKIGNFMLKWNDDNGQFGPIESESDMNEGIFLEFIEQKDKWQYFYLTGASLIPSRTALRSANGISKTGYVHPQTNVRYGINCKLEEQVSPYEDMPEDLKKSQRAWYKGEYSQY